MKRTLICLLTLALIIAFVSAGCGDKDNTPSACATRFLEALKADELSDVENIYPYGQIDPAQMVFGENSLNDQAEEMFNDKARGFDYMFGDISEQDSLATVTVNVTAYNLGASISELALASNQAAKSLMDSLAKAGQAPFSAEANTALVNQLGQAEKSYEQTVKLTLTKKGDQWTVDEIRYDSDFFTAITGNTPATLSSLSAAYKKTMAESASQEPSAQSSPGSQEPEQQAQAQTSPADYEIDDMDEAIKAVEDYLRLDDDDPDKPYIRVDSEDSAAYTVLCYELIPNSDGTNSEAIIGYFLVDKVTGQVSEKDAGI